ncbi:stage V sporulation protein AA [Tuberibacillus sp. Marseille-P3662]|uniref:stage V sporulation protein AA n=1 Tax=Tuberibacillus sp. Marseille-P3662 TaxID=1965358 RepID=UPI000A1CC235|nr:stage V sporulation protein AA [Tuberibacillus sp. Marseille-P3662]
MSEVSIYVRMRQKIMVNVNEVVTIGTLANIVAPEHIKKRLVSMNIYHITPADNKFTVVDVMDIITNIYKQFPEADIQTVGPTQTILEVKPKKRKSRPLLFLLIWLILFIGSGLTIMNFHEDVAMGEVHQKLYSLITGEHKGKPLILQIPYSLGLGIGMILFFNHIFKKKFNEEPSPLEVEMFNYQQDLDQYVIVHEYQKRQTGQSND